jgi:hypothetical protein
MSQGEVNHKRKPKGTKRKAGGLGAQAAEEVSLEQTPPPSSKAKRIKVVLPPSSKAKRIKAVLPPSALNFLIDQCLLPDSTKGKKQAVMIRETAGLLEMTERQQLQQEQLAKCHEEAQHLLQQRHKAELASWASKCKQRLESVPGNNSRQADSHSHTVCVSVLWQMMMMMPTKTRTWWSPIKKRTTTLTKSRVATPTLVVHRPDGVAPLGALT